MRPLTLGPILPRPPAAAFAVALAPRPWSAPVSSARPLRA